MTLALFGLLLYHGVLSYAAVPASVIVPSEARLTATASAPVLAGKIEATAAKKIIKKTAPTSRLSIPSLGVNAIIEHVGLTAQGSMGVPRDPMNAGWYEFGPRPGELGSAVIDGHVNWFRGATGVFANLQLVKPGAKITVRSEDGKAVTFVVHEVRTFDPSANAEEIFSSGDGQSHLNLITCGGVWDKKTQQYSERIVVFADKIGE